MISGEFSRMAFQRFTQACVNPVEDYGTLTCPIKPIKMREINDLNCRNPSQNAPSLPGFPPRPPHL